MTKSEAIEKAKIIKALIGIAEVSIILNTFIKTFQEKAIIKGNGRSYLHGNFNITGTVSGRMSSSGPNLQNLPSTGSRYAKAIKECFQAPEGWLMVGADFSSLEDKISALTTRDPQKLRVYTDGYDGHSLRAFSYFGDQMPDIQNTVESINSISSKYPSLRQDSKGPTFCLTYGGTKHALIGQCGLSESAADAIEKAYHDLYSHSDEYVKKRLEQAARDGYVEVAFGLRVRTPILRQILLGKRSTPYAGQAEGRTAGNAMGQSYGLLNNRASNEFMQRVWDSKYRLDVLPICQIHDSSYYLVRNQVSIVKWVNDNLIECMQWQELPEIEHNEVKLGGSLEVFEGSWAHPHELPNNASKKEILDICS